MSYTTGISAITSAVKNAREKSEGTNGPPAQLFNWRDGDRKIIWILDDSQIVTIARHDWVPCPDDKDHHFSCAEKLNEPRPCPIRNKDGKHPTPRELCVAQVAWLKEYPSSTEGGRVMRPEFVDYDGKRYSEADNKRDWAPGIWLVVQAPKNFWAIFESYAIRNGKLDDQPYEVERKGGDAQTIYVPIPYFTSDTEKNVQSVLTEDMKKKLGKALKEAVNPIDWNERMGAASRFSYYFKTKSEELEVDESKRGFQGSKESGLGEFAQKNTKNIDTVKSATEIIKEKKQESITGNSLRSQLLDYSDEKLPF